MLKDMLLKAKEFHGHICPFLALGIKASTLAMQKLGIGRSGEEESIEESVLAIVECNNCFADGVQVATGCTFGNNSLIYYDLGKNAVTIVRRGEWKGIRIYVDGEKIMGYFPKEALELFNKVIVRREGSEEDRKRLSKVWEEVGFKMLEVPEEAFKIEEVKVKPIEPAPIVKSVRCKKCGELVMDIRTVNGLCLKCAGEKIHAVIGRGIVHMDI